MGVVLFEHNETAYKSAVSMLDTTGKAAVIHPTGTGKSFIALKLCEENPEKRVCWLSPSEYIFRTQMENWKSAFNIPEFIAKEKKERKITDQQQNISFYTYAKLMRMGQAELAQIKPDYIILDEFHRCGAAQWGGGVERLCGMYQKAKVLGLSATSIRYLDNQRDMAWELFEGNIASELTLGEAIARGILPMPTYVLSVYSYQRELKRYEAQIQRAKNSAVREKAKQQLEALRRALEQADGLEEIFAKYMIPVEGKEEQNKKENPNDLKRNAEDTAEQIKIQNNRTNIEPASYTKEKNLNPSRKESKQACGKYVVFCANYDHLNEMKELAPEWFARVDSAPHIYTVYSEEKQAAQEFRAFQQDQSCHLKLLYCIDMLNEGIHLNDIDGVILLRPTVSPTIYKQQIGRALAAGKKKTPVIFDIVMNIENLYSIGAVEEELREAVFSYRAMGKENELVNERFQIVDEVQDCRKLFTQLNETLGASWDLMYAMAEQYFKQYVNLKVPKSYRKQEGYSLGMWLATQKKVYAGKVAGNLSRAQIKKLEKIGIKWQGTRELAWEKHYAEAVEYYKEHGHLLVGMEQLCKQQERKIKRNTTNPDKNDLGILSKNLLQENADKKSDQNLEQSSGLKEDIKTEKDRENNDLKSQKSNQKKSANQEKKRKTKKDDKEIQLARWLARIRLERKKLQEIKKVENKEIEQKKCFKQKKEESFEMEKGKQNPKINQSISLTQERIALLNEIGMVWDAPDFIWEQYFAAAEQYYKRFGNLDVPTYYVDADGIRLGRWIAKERKQSDLTKEQILRLSEIGMIWEGKHHATWEKSYAIAYKYYKEHGNLDVPVSYITEDGFQLGRWVRRQRETYQTIAKVTKDLKIDSTSKENGNNTNFSKQSVTRMQKLSQIGLNWELKDSWERRFQLAKQYYKEHGNFDMPSDFVIDGVWLARWIREQRIRLAAEVEKCTLTKVQIEKLNSIGISGEHVVSKAERAWQKQYNEAKEFYIRNGHLFIPKCYTSRDGKHLGAWLQHQRTGRREGRLSGWQTTLLDEINMVWEFDDPWQIGYQHAKEYYEKYGNLAVPNSYLCIDGYRLGKWISNQRYDCQKRLRLEQIQQLNEIGMIWNAKIKIQQK